MKTPFPLKKNNDGFLLKINKMLFKEEVVYKAVLEDQDWVGEVPSADTYLCVQLKTMELDEALNWANYLIYLHKV